jgi:phosphoribosylformimino-5-aminoimidazole carboxamide ribotide isomerase
MEVIPALDIIAGRCVRLSQGRFNSETVFSPNPVEMAKRWQDEGAKRLHVADLDGVRFGTPQNFKVIEKIINSINIPVQLGGGIRNLEVARSAMQLGVSRVILGTSAALYADTAAQVFAEFGDTAILSVDTLNGYVAVSGCQARTEERAVDFALRMQSIGARRIIFTDVLRDGMLSGVNRFAVERMVKSVSVPVIASGGVSSIEDVKLLKPLEEIGLEGILLGKALYTGSIRLPEALQIS